MMTTNVGNTEPIPSPWEELETLLNQHAAAEVRINNDGIGWSDGELHLVIDALRTVTFSADHCASPGAVARKLVAKAKASLQDSEATLA